MLTLVERKQVPSLLAVLLFTNRCKIKVPKDIRKKLLKYFAKVYIYDYTCIDGIHRYSVDGKLHRENAPALIYSDGEQRWYKKGTRHRNDGPAVIKANGDQYWYKEDICHREDGPAIIRTNGTQEWYKYGKKHRVGVFVNEKPEDGPAAIYAMTFSNENVHGDQVWCIRGVQVEPFC